MQVVGEGDGVQEHMKTIFWGPAGGKDAQLLDEVFSGFVATNFFQGQHYSFHMLLEIKEKMYFRFEHGGVPYLATVYRRREHDGDKVVFKLPNSGFSYLTKVAGQSFHWHKRPGWVTLPGREAVAQFPTLQRVVSGQYSKVVIFYNYEACRIDMEFEPKLATDPTIVVTYEPGWPFIDTTSMRQPF